MSHWGPQCSLKIWLRQQRFIQWVIYTNVHLKLYNTLITTQFPTRSQCIQGFLMGSLGFFRNFCGGEIKIAPMLFWVVPVSGIINQLHMITQTVLLKGMLSTSCCEYWDEHRIVLRYSSPSSSWVCALKFRTWTDSGFEFSGWLSDHLSLWKQRSTAHNAPQQNVTSGLNPSMKEHCEALRSSHGQCLRSWPWGWYLAHRNLSDSFIQSVIPTVQSSHLLHCLCGFPLVSSNSSKTDYLTTIFLSQVWISEWRAGWWPEQCVTPPLA